MAIPGAFQSSSHLQLLLLQYDKVRQSMLFLLLACKAVFCVLFFLVSPYRNKSAALKPSAYMAFTFSSKLLKWVNQIHTASPLRLELHIPLWKYPSWPILNTQSALLNVSNFKFYLSCFKKDTYFDVLTKYLMKCVIWYYI